MCFIATAAWPSGRSKTAALGRTRSKPAEDRRPKTERESSSRFRSSVFGLLSSVLDFSRRHFGQKLFQDLGEGEPIDAGEEFHLHRQGGENVLLLDQPHVAGDLPEL